MKRLPSLFIATLLFSAVAMARGSDGLLSLIITPNNGVPAMTLPGGTFDAVLREKAEPLRLIRGSDAKTITAEWTPLPGGAFRAKCAVPSDTPTGAWTMEATANGQKDEMARAVFVFDSFPDYYVIAHMSDVHVGNDKLPAPSEEIFRKSLAAVNDSDALFVLITGDLTHGGEPGQFGKLLAALDTCNVPTFVTPGNHDRDALNYESFFGPVTYRFRFGNDGYLAFDTKDYVTADSLGPQDGLLHQYRRELKDCRWTLGFTHRYEPMMGMRAQMTLFIDDPLDMLLFGHIHRELDPAKGEGNPWGTTPFVAVPAELNGKIRFLDITAQGPIPRPVTEIK